MKASLTDSKQRETRATLSPDDLVCLMGLIIKDGSTGTNKFQSQWSIIDQFIVSGNMLDRHCWLKASEEGGRIYRESFLLEKDETNLGFRLNRTYVGPVYHGGFSDHLPVYLDLIIQQR